MNGWDVAIAVFVFVVIVACEHINRRIPGALIGLVIADRGDGRAGVAGPRRRGAGHHPRRAAVGRRALGVVARRAPPHRPFAHGRVPLHRPDRRTVRAAGKGTPAPDDFDRDLVALGAGSLASGFIGSFAVNSSPPRTEVVSSTGGPHPAGRAHGRRRLARGRALRNRAAERHPPGHARRHPRVRRDPAVPGGGAAGDPPLRPPRVRPRNRDPLRGGAVRHRGRRGGGGAAVAVRSDASQRAAPRRGPGPRARHRPLDPARHRAAHRTGRGGARLPHLRTPLVRQRQLRGGAGASSSSTIRPRR